VEFGVERTAPLHENGSVVMENLHHVAERILCATGVSDPIAKTEKYFIV
jgi:hypothetical protein